MPAEIITDDDGTEVEPQPWDALAIYRRSSEFRRVLFLELMAWTIRKVERFETREDAEAFLAQLRKSRERHWGVRPWSGATDEEAFHRHVLAMAATFANADPVAGVEYPGRTRPPRRRS